MRNCASQYSKLSQHRDPMSVRALDGRSATYPNGELCGDGIDGGDPTCVVGYFARKDSNPAIKITEKHLAEAIKNNGPVSATLVVRKDLIDHMQKNIEIPYVENKLSPIVGYHSVAVVGYGVTEDNTKYWKCEDSNKSSKGEFRKYRILAGQAGIGNELVANTIKNPLPFKEKQTQGIGNVQHGGDYDIYSQFWNGVKVHDWKKSGLQNVYDEWARAETG